MGILQAGFSKWGSERGWVGVRRDYSYVFAAAKRRSRRMKGVGSTYILVQRTGHRGTYCEEICKYNKLFRKIPEIVYTVYFW
jgi:hypothetical protein